MPEVIDGHIYLNRRELCDELGTHPKTVQVWTKQGLKFRTQGRGAGHLYRVADVLNFLLQQHSAEAIDPARERATRDRAARELLEIEKAQKLRQLVDGESVVKHWSALIGAARGRLLALPNRGATIAVSCNSVDEIEHELRDLVYEALEELGHDPFPPDVPAPPEDEPEAA